MAVFFARRGLSQFGSLHFAHERGLSPLCRGSHSCPHRQRHPINRTMPISASINVTVCFSTNSRSPWCNVQVGIGELEGYAWATKDTSLHANGEGWNSQQQQTYDKRATTGWCRPKAGRSSRTKSGMKSGSSAALAQITGRAAAGANTSSLLKNGGSHLRLVGGRS